MSWCCDSFHRATQNRDDDGFVAYIVPPTAGHDNPAFGIGFRAIRRELVPQLQKAIIGMSGNIKISGGIGLRFCPWCGVRLADHYRTSFRDIIDEDITREFHFI